MLGDSDLPFKLGFLGLSEHERVLLSRILSNSHVIGELAHTWVVAQPEEAHAVLYDLASVEGQTAWGKAQNQRAPIPIAYGKIPIPDSRWFLPQPVERTAFLNLLKQLSLNLEQRKGENIERPQSSPEHALEDSPSTIEITLPTWRDRLSVIAEHHQRSDPAAKEIKIVFGGGTGAGKSTALRTISEVEPIQTEVRPSDLVRNKKDETTVALDYGELRLTDQKRLRLYGTPGQGRYDFMTEIVCKGALGVVLLASNASGNPLFELNVYLRRHKQFAAQNAMVLGITHVDQKTTPTLQEYERFLSGQNISIPVFPVDVRKKEDVMSLVEVLVTQLEKNVEAQT